jgi:YidC/Oxa1 family membrane protein insertase
MPLWNQVVALLRESIFAYAQLCHGNLGCGILIVTFLARLALTPLGIRLARMARVQQRAMQRIQPELEALRAKYKGNSQKIAEETHRLMGREGVSMVPAGALGGLAQIPILVALYSTVRQVATVGGRFLWIGDIAKPDFILAIVVTGITLVASATGSTSQSANQTMLLLLSAVVTAAVLSKMAAGVGLYWGLSTLFGAAQGIVARSEHRPHAA